VPRKDMVGTCHRKGGDEPRHYIAIRWFNWPQRNCSAAFQGPVMPPAHEAEASHYIFAWHPSLLVIGGKSMREAGMIRFAETAIFPGVQQLFFIRKAITSGRFSC